MKAVSGGPVLVTGAAGKTGRAVSSALLSSGLSVRGLVRDTRQSTALTELGVQQVLVGDLEAPSTLEAPLEGVRTVYHICPNMHPAESELGRRVIELAEGAGVESFVLHSVLQPQIEAMPHHWAKLRVEERLMSSTLDFTILQPAPYMQNLLGSWREVVEEGRLVVPYSLSSRIVMVDLAEVAEVAARVLVEDGHRGATYELCGSGCLDQREVAAEISRQIGREVDSVQLPLAEWVEAALRSGLDPRRVDRLVAMFRWYDRHGLDGSSRVMSCLLGRRPRGLRDFLERLIARPA